MAGGADILVVGGGIAGWSAARAAQTRGARVTLVEKSESDPGMGNTVLSGGVFHAAFLDPATRAPEELFEAIMRATAGGARKDVARAWAGSARRAREFLAAEGGWFERGGADEFRAQTLMPPRSRTHDIRDPAAWRGMGPDLLLRAMRDAFARAGGTVVAGTRAVRLAEGPGGVLGLHVESAAGERRLLPARAVVLADGGFHADRALVARHITAAYAVRGTLADVGDALRMGLEVGATTVDMAAFYGHPVVRDGSADGGLWPDPKLDALIGEGMLVDGAGRRIVDEHRSPADPEALDTVAGPIAWCDTPGDCWALLGDEAWHGVGRTGKVPVNPTLVEVGAAPLTATDPGALARAAGLPPDRLCETVAAYNRRCAGEGRIDPPRSGRPRPLAGLLYAIPVIAGITHTMGGLLVDGHARVLGADEAPVPGLYAAGGSMGGLQGGPANRGYTGGWSEAATFGLLGGEHAAALAALPSG